MTSDATLRRRRRMLLLISLPVVILVLLTALRLIGQAIVVDRGINDYDGGDHGAAEMAFSLLEHGNVVQRDVAAFDRGNALYRQGDFAGAEDAYSTALDRAPEDRSCPIRFNLVLAIEKQGDAQQESGDREAAKKHWQRALDAVDAADCGNDEDVSPLMPVARERIENKMRDETSPPTTDPSSDPTSQPPTSNPTDEQTQQPTQNPTDGSTPTDQPTSTPTDMQSPGEDKLEEMRQRRPENEDGESEGPRRHQWDEEDADEEGPGDGRKW